MSDFDKQNHPWSKGVKYSNAIGFNLSNGVTDTLESSTILIYSDKHMSLYTLSLGRIPSLIK